MTDPNRPPSTADRPCNNCGEPMIGIMRISDVKPYTAPRAICHDCVNGLMKPTEAA